MWRYGPQVVLNRRSPGMLAISGTSPYVPLFTQSRGPKLTPDSQLVLRLTPEDGGMNKTRILLFGSVVAVAMIGGGVIGATGLVKSPVAAFAAASATPTPTPKSNEATAHENGESAAREAAENSGRAFGPGGGHPNETPAHETGETAAREAAENAGVKPAATP
jgi:hypothetical protein